MKTKDELPIEQSLAIRIHRIDMICDRVHDADPKWAISADKGIVEIKKVCEEALKQLVKESENGQ